MSDIRIDTVGKQIKITCVVCGHLDIHKCEKKHYIWCNEYHEHINQCHSPYCWCDWTIHHPK